MRQRILCSLLLILALALPQAALAEVHWARPSADALAGRVAWDVPADLNRPVTVAEWNSLVAAVFRQKPGKATYEESPDQYNLWIYTGGLATGDYMVREDAIGGLIKLLNVFYRTAHDKVPHSEGLTRFGDAASLSSHQRVLVGAAAVWGLVGGYPDGTVRPRSLLTVGEAVVLAERVLLQIDSVTAPDPFADIPGPLGFGNALPQPAAFRPDYRIGGGSKGGAGGLYLVVHGAATAFSLPGAGTAAPGHTWLLLDAELVNKADAPLTLTRWGLEDGAQLLYRYEMDRTATAELGSPLADPKAVLEPGKRMRGLVVFQVPLGTKGVWYHLQTAVGRSKDPDNPYNGGQRWLVGDVPGPERVFPDSGRDGSVYQVEGLYLTQPEAERVTTRARAQGHTAWIEAEADGQYAAVVDFTFFQK